MSKPQKDLTHCRDEELFRLAPSNKDAFSTLFDRHATDLYLCIKQIRRAHTNEAQAMHEAQQILIDVFVPVVCHCQPILASGSVASYLFASARQKANDYGCQSDNGPSNLLI